MRVGIVGAPLALCHAHATAAVCAARVLQLLADDGFVPKEGARLRKMLDDSALAGPKREEFTQRLNMLQSFERAPPPQPSSEEKTEL